MESTHIWRPSVAVFLSGLSLLPLPVRAAGLAPAGGLTAVVTEALLHCERADQLYAGLLETLRKPETLEAMQGWPARERLIVIGPDKQILRIIEGQEGLIEVDWELELQLYRPGAEITLVHNHPRGSGLSTADLEHLAKPGVAGVMAVGHDGSLYFAKPSADAHRRLMIRAATNEIARLLRAERRQGKDAKAFDLQLDHLVSLGLGKAGGIDYQFALSAARVESFTRLEALFSRITDLSAQKVREALRQVVAVPGAPQ